MNKRGRRVEDGLHNIQGVVQTHGYVLWIDRFTSDFLGNDE